MFQGTINMKRDTVDTRWQHQSNFRYSPSNNGTLMRFFVNRTSYTESYFERTIVNVDLQARLVTLVIDNLQLSDEGIYRCRVDFRWSRTFSKFYQLKIIGKLLQLLLFVFSKFFYNPVPPKKLSIYDDDRRFLLNDLAGPYREGQSMIKLTCETKGLFVY